MKSNYKILVINEIITYQYPVKIKIHIHYLDPSHLIPKYTPERNSTHIFKETCTRILSEEALRSTNNGTNNGIMYIMETTIVTYINMNESHNHEVEGKK